MENKDKTPCNEHAKCMELLELILDGEAKDGEKDYYFAHIEQCMPCYRAHNLESAIRTVLKNNVDKKEVPADLVTCIKSKIQETV